LRGDGRSEEAVQLVDTDHDQKAAAFDTTSCEMTLEVDDNLHVPYEASIKTCLPVEKRCRSRLGCTSYAQTNTCLVVARNIEDFARIKQPLRVDGLLQRPHEVNRVPSKLIDKAVLGDILVSSRLKVFQC
jgi:hypothetical protein